MKKTLSKWQQLNLRSGVSGSTVATVAVVVQSFTGVAEATVPYPAEWVAVLPDVSVYKDSILLNQNSYTAHVATDHVRIVFRITGDYTIKLRA